MNWLIDQRKKKSESVVKAYWTGYIKRFINRIDIEAGYKVLIGTCFFFLSVAYICLGNPFELREVMKRVFGCDISLVCIATGWIYSYLGLIMATIIIWKSQKEDYIRNSGKYRYKVCKVGLNIIFIPNLVWMYLAQIGKQCMLYVKQDKVMRYYPVILVSFSAHTILYIVTILKWLEGWEGPSWICDNNELSSMIIVISWMIGWHIWNRVFIDITMIYNNTSKKARELKSKSKKCWMRAMKNQTFGIYKSIKAERIVVYNQLKVTQLYGYLVICFLLLCCPTDGWQEVLKNTFFGVTTLAGLSREIRTKIELE